MVQFLSKKQKSLDLRSLLTRIEFVSVIFEMMIEGESFPDSGPAHDLEADTID